MATEYWVAWVRYRLRRGPLLTDISHAAQPSTRAKHKLTCKAKRLASFSVAKHDALPPLDLSRAPLSPRRPSTIKATGLSGVQPPPHNWPRKSARLTGCPPQCKHQRIFLRAPKLHGPSCGPVQRSRKQSMPPMSFFLVHACSTPCTASRC